MQLIKKITRKFLKFIKRFFSLAPLLLAVFFVFSIYLHNIKEVSLSDLIIPLIVTLVFFIILSVLFYLVFKKKEKRTLLLSIFIFLFFYYSEAVYLLDKTKITSIGGNRILFPLWLVLIVIFYFVIRRTKKNLLALNKFIFIFSIIMVIIPLFSIIRYETTQRIHLKGGSQTISLNSKDVTLKDGLPDIYYILPDSYSANSVIKNDFNFDNSDFTNYLEDKGFYVAYGTTSNYPKTFLSLSSALNMEYLDFLEKYKNSSDQTIVNPMIKDSSVLEFLKNLGYKYYQLGSWWGATNNDPLANKNFTIENSNKENITEFENVILQSTMLKPIMIRLLPTVIISSDDNSVRERNDYQFEELPKVAELPGPKFVFAHILTPHEPYVYGKNCESVTRDQISGNTNEVNYTNQVQCVNQKLEDTINGIIQNSTTPPVILLQADEGAGFLRYELNPVDSWENASDDLLKQKFPIFSAYYLPGVSTSTMYPTITPVNSFREIFNLYFSTNLPLLPDKNYIFPNLNNVYQFEDITDRVQIQKK